ncbi:putative protein [Arabidopsis thaliana]|jgi:hypothetical protein|uniref:Zinc metalloproteinase aureolysin n=3 Tax=Arabidopsis TaxID=3701 RepID=Q9LYC9_ARATH|nr:zinc metalloproteinase aureolysin [Arabidopsis thaliana]KAG7635398.1 hypothetical protein ISN44_As03g054960 [Arabidopsis suecica]AEE80411.1 zinc metalloproteinase aureolysin [Arabidopsis thaliana]CAA0388174.1 unnamed protein product [Arabidopsis thaliana]CAB87737.1 putative protein [Arabidopsis thaliana]CAD5326589.1 unnamed protein product [Arabidopsis thaliana]|eukprot:NP_191851.1 zinc metalloproteinase aureolysin [Arabidopsis thaliana]
MSIYRIARALPFSGILRQLEKEAETVINVLQPGPLGIIEHKFSAQEIREAKATVSRAVDSWRRHSEVEHANGLLKDYIYK